MTTTQPLVRIEESLIIGLEIRRYADGYWQIDGLTSCSGHLAASDRIPLVSGKVAIGQANAGMLQRLLMEQLASVVTLTGEWENL